MTKTAIELARELCALAEEYRKNDPAADRDALCQALCDAEERISALPICSALLSVQERLDKACELLRVHAEQFEFYEKQHRAKGTPEADAKANVNQVLAETARAFLTEQSQ